MLVSLASSICWHWSGDELPHVPFAPRHAACQPAADRTRTAAPMRSSHIPSPCCNSSSKNRRSNACIAVRYGRTHGNAARYCAICFHFAKHRCQ